MQTRSTVLLCRLKLVEKIQCATVILPVVEEHQPSLYDEKRK